MNIFEVRLCSQAGMFLNSGIELLRPIELWALAIVTFGHKTVCLKDARSFGQLVILTYE